jgi:hypothetical protein
MLTLVGCGGGSSLAGSPVASLGNGNLTVHVELPATGARYIPSWTGSIDIVVSGAGMTDVIGTVTRDTPSATLTVPAGDNRTVTLYGKDGDGVAMVSMGQATGVKIFPRTSNSVTIYLGGQEDYSGTPVQIALSGTTAGGTLATGSAEAIIETRNGQGTDDTFEFTGVSGQKYTIAFTNIEQVIFNADEWYYYDHGLEFVASSPQTGTLNQGQAYKGYDSSDLLQPTSFDVTATEDGPITITVHQAWQLHQCWALYYRITVTETGDANLDVNAM